MHYASRMRYSPKTVTSECTAVPNDLEMCMRDCRAARAGQSMHEARCQTQPGKPISKRNKRISPYLRMTSEDMRPKHPPPPPPPVSLPHFPIYHRNTTNPERTPPSIPTSHLQNRTERAHACMPANYVVSMPAQTCDAKLVTRGINLMNEEFWES